MAKEVGPIAESPPLAEAFPLVADNRCRVLVLGSLPGAQSLHEGRYYAHPRNQFWQLMSAVVAIDLPSLAYPDRLTALVARGVGLWDVVASARRAGSLDSALREITPRDLQTVIMGMPDLRVLAFNGLAAFKIGRRQLGKDPPVPVLAHPSSSPAHTVGLVAKAAAWSGLADYLG